MARAASRYICQECGQEVSKWMGRCPGCDQWNTLVEERPKASLRSEVGAGFVSAALRIDAVVQAAQERQKSGIRELDRVLGGGVVPGSLLLVGGDPGVGKSTLLLQVAAGFAQMGLPVLYVSGEESPAQIRIRAERLRAVLPSLLLLTETDVGLVAAEISQHRPALVIIDSIQTMALTDLDSTPGSVTQVRECAAVFLRVAKATGIPIFLVGHVNKTGSLAGPKVLEHVVDVVLDFEGDRHTSVRILRSSKNRFGSTEEVGLFEMKEGGLAEIENPSSLFLSERPIGAPGSVVVAGLEGTRPLLIEIQALVGPTAFGGTPKRQATGVDAQRVAMILAVLERRVGLSIGTHDVYVNAVGGLRVEEPAADLGIALAVASSFKNVPILPDLSAIGEVGLAGEVRSIRGTARRVAESAALGFRRIMVPAGASVGPAGMGEIELVPLRSLRQAIRLALDASPDGKEGDSGGKRPQGR